MKRADKRNRLRLISAKKKWVLPDTNIVFEAVYSAVPVPPEAVVRALMLHETDMPVRAMLMSQVYSVPAAKLSVLFLLQKHKACKLRILVYTLCCPNFLLLTYAIKFHYSIVFSKNLKPDKSQHHSSGEISCRAKPLSVLLPESL
ncbi:MAG: hypothetical protein LBD21_03480, partial [Tannerellaceae bacterium]|nr:hypothetical protein [Tannerellaceae bacterium]